MRIEFHSEERMNSQWVQVPRIVGLATGGVVSDLERCGALGTSWEGGGALFWPDGRFRMTFAQWPHRTPTITAVFDPREWTVTHDLGGESKTESTQAFAQRLANTRLHKDS